ncbi:MAG TPA: M24 family metallopeptidase [Thermoanaerobaculaceae bacterium]|nr:M24 family metallopeptidase [Thermoanaerobaculaceae bacterium]
MIRAKIAQAVGILNELDIDAWMTFVRESWGLHDPCIDLVVGGNVTWQSAFIITRRGERIAILGSLDKAAHEILGHYDQIIPYVKGIGEPLRETLARLDPRRIAINFSVDDELADGLSYGMYLLLQNTLRGTPYAERLVSSEGIVSRLRSRKLEPELARITHACAETVDVFAQLHKRLKAGMTEKEIAAVMVEIMESKGLERAWEADQCPAVYTGPESAGAHAGPTDRRMEPGHLMNVDFGVRYEGFCSDLQRTWYCLRPGEKDPPAIVMKGFDAVRDAVRKAAAFLRPGVKGHEVDAVARGHIVAQGFEEYPHALGHQIGRFAHDGAGLLCPVWERYGEKPFAVVEEGQCYTLEPRVPVPGHGVATVEEVVVVTKDGCRFLSEPQTEILLVRGHMKRG